MLLQICFVFFYRLSDNKEDKGSKKDENNKEISNKDLTKIKDKCSLNKRHDSYQDTKNPDKIQEFAVILICTGFSVLIIIVSGIIIIFIIKNRHRNNTGTKKVSCVKSENDDVNCENVNTTRSESKSEVRCSRFDTLNGYRLSRS